MNVATIVLPTSLSSFLHITVILGSDQKKMAQGKEVIFKPRLIKEDDLYGKIDGYTLNLIKPNIYQFSVLGSGCHVYLIIGETLNVLIDTGIITKFNSLNYLLTTEVGLKVEDISLVINTHEHFDHISSNPYFPK